jgi:hypothetical protein
MKAKGITGKGCYRTYYFIPKWFVRQFHETGNGALLNVKGSRHYVGKGFNAKKKTWTDGAFLTDFEAGLPYWERYAADADFIIHFGGAL